MSEPLFQLAGQPISIESLLLLMLGAAGIGISKSGFSGVSMVHVIVFAFVFGALPSTGILLPMLILGDLLAVYFFGHHVQWKYVWKLMPPAMIGVVIGTLFMSQVDDRVFRPLIGCVIMGLTLMQIARIWRPSWFEKVPHSVWFAWTMGVLAGITTMIANAAGPVIAIYLLAISLPKLEFVGTSAWFFLTLNTFKVPFSLGLGLIDAWTLLLDIGLAPMILIGMLLGRWLVKRISQQWFDSLLLLFTAIASLRLIGIL